MKKDTEVDFEGKEVGIKYDTPTKLLDAESRKKLFKDASVGKSDTLMGKLNEMSPITHKVDDPVGNLFKTKLKKKPTVTENSDNDYLTILLENKIRQIVKEELQNIINKI